MKIIISHDIDHLTFSEHWKDLFIPKYLIRAKLEWLSGKISFQELLLRWLRFLKNKYHNIPEILEYDASMNIPSTFFLGFNKGRGLSYSHKKAGFWNRFILDKGFDTGVHGNSGSEFNALKHEHFLFLGSNGSPLAGIRMHYLAVQEKTKQNMADAGYSFDSSEYAMKIPYKVDALWEFPVQIMDSYEIEGDSFKQKYSLQKALENSIKRIQQANELKLPYLVVIFHDCYFSDSHSTWKNWYLEIIKYLQNNGYTFISFKDAVKELNSNSLV